MGITVNVLEESGAKVVRLVKWACYEGCFDFLKRFKVRERL